MRRSQKVRRCCINRPDFPNTKAAYQALDDFCKRFETKACLSPTADCDGRIVSAHTLAVESVLRPISRNAHVYTPQRAVYNIVESGDFGQLVLKGIRDTSVFNGFCAKHDNAIFAPIEDGQFICTYNQLFLYAYRAVAYECYMRRQRCESLMTPDTFRAIHCD